MTTTRFLAIADEALFSGSARSQVKGEAHHAVSVFPPPPGTWQGALRTRILYGAGTNLADPKEIEAVVGPPDALPAGWQIEGPWLSEVVDGALVPWVPLPQCVRRVDGPYLDPAWPFPAPDVGRRRVEIAQCDSAALTPDLTVLLDADAPPDLPRALAPDLRGAWIDAAGLAQLLAGKDAALPSSGLPPFAQAEDRVGLELTPGRTAARGMLYFRESHRVTSRHADRQAGFYGLLTAPKSGEHLTKGTLAIGRRRRALALEEAPPVCTDWADVVNGVHLSRPIPDESEFWLVLASPVALDDPERWGTPTLPKLPPAPGVRFEVRAAVLHLPVRLGGLRVDRTARTNRALLQPGTAWRVRIHGSDATQRARALRDLHHATRLGDPADHPFGYGRVWVAFSPEDPT